ncbi:hypothetical protein HAX54_027644 [Datura stramonium]|uniref:Uncharacterized protein n=1 Tax=Datura stramonium TaxID=4076 RepID=A0ABS8V2V2_DATST|nr:hypothetical protein [Datura stramonium]
MPLNWKNDDVQVLGTFLSLVMHPNVGYTRRKSETHRKNVDITSRTADGSPTLSSVFGDSSQPTNHPAKRRYKARITSATKTPKTKGPHRYIIVPTVCMGARPRGANNSRFINSLYWDKPIQSHSTGCDREGFHNGARPRGANNSRFINSLYWDKPIQSHSTFRRKVDDKANQFQWNTTEVPIEVSILIACIIDHVHINVGEIIADQFKRRAKQQATSFPYPSLISMLCVRASCPLFHPLDKTVRANGVITLATKTEKDAPAMNRAKGIENRTPPPSSVPSNTLEGQFQEAAASTTTPPTLLKLV